MDPATTVERCAACGFDGADWSDDAALEMISLLPGQWVDALAGFEPGDLQRRPIAEMWSIAEYADHVREVLFGMRFVLDSALNQPGVDLGDAPEPAFSAQPTAIDVRAALAGIQFEAETLRDGLTALPEASWASTASIGGDTVDGHWICRHAVHDATHHLGDVARLQQALG